MATEDSVPARPPAKRKSIFSRRPAWAQQARSETPSDVSSEIFTRSNLGLDELLRLKEEQHQLELERRERAKAEKEKRKSEGNGAEKSAEKRRRITDDTYAAFGLVSPTKQAEGDRIAEEPGSSRREREEQTKYVDKDRARGTQHNVISLDSDDEQEHGAARATTSAAAADDPAADLIESDEEFPELAAIARERRRQREAEALSAKDSDRPSTQPDPENDPVIKVLITSPIADTNPLLVHRRLSQRLMEIRQVWCQRQGFTEEEAQTVFLTYKLRRLYDVTTCKSLGIKVDTNGRVIGDRPGDVFRTSADDDDGGKVHLIALTEESFEEMKKQRQAEKLAAATAVMPEADDEDENDESSKPAEEEPKIRVLIKAKGYKDYKLIVRPSTTCERILAAFRRENKLDTEQALVLTFDGEAIEPEDTVSQTEIEDMDNLEVHLR